MEGAEKSFDKEYPQDADLWMEERLDIKLTSLLKQRLHLTVKDANRLGSRHIGPGRAQVGPFEFYVERRRGAWGGLYWELLMARKCWVCGAPCDIAMLYEADMVNYTRFDVRCALHREHATIGEAPR